MKVPEPKTVKKHVERLFVNDPDNPNGIISNGKKIDLDPESPNPQVTKEEKKNQLVCMFCSPPKPMSDHKFLSGKPVHERVDCPPDILYMVSDDLFELIKDKT